MLSRIFAFAVFCPVMQAPVLAALVVMKGQAGIRTMLQKLHILSTLCELGRFLFTLHLARDLSRTVSVVGGLGW